MQGLIVLTTTPDLKSAKEIAKSLVTQKLAACVSYRSGFISTYRWKGKVERSKETVLLIKTLTSHFVKIRKVIQALHPYQLPELIALPIIRGSRDYLAWMNEVLK